jgi:putative hydrolase of the HAD superfamily
VREPWVFFDVGGTLLDPYPSFAERFKMVLAEHGHVVELASIRIGLDALPDLFADAARSGELWTTSLDRSRRFWGAVYDRVLERVEVATRDGLADSLYETFTSFETYALFDDVGETLAALRAARYRLGIVSNFEDWLPGLLEHLGVRELFDVRVISGVEGIEKPEPAIFELALERAGTSAADATYVGDVPAFDVDAPMALGMRGVLLDRRDRYPVHYGPRIDDLRKLPAMLAAIE